MSNASNSYQLIPKFKEGDIVVFPGFEAWLRTDRNRSTPTEIYKIDSVEPHITTLRSGAIHATSRTGCYRCRMWSFTQREWVNSLRESMKGNDGRAIFFWGSPLEKQMEVVEPLGLLVKWGIG